jgi:hypothetical protein
MNHVIAVTNLDDRDKLVRAMRTRYSLKQIEQPGIHVVQDKIHRLLIYDGEKIIHTITVVTVPFVCNLNPLEDMAGMEVKFTVSALLEAIDQLKARVLHLVQNPNLKKSRDTLNAIVDRLTF